MSVSPKRVHELLAGYATDQRRIGGLEFSNYLLLTRWYFAGSARALALAGFDDEAQLCWTIADSSRPDVEIINALKIAKNETEAAVAK